jgi:hypothetical protein
MMVRIKIWWRSDFAVHLSGGHAQLAGAVPIPTGIWIRPAGIQATATGFRVAFSQRAITSDARTTALDSGKLTHARRSGTYDKRRIRNHAIFRTPRTAAPPIAGGQVFGTREKTVRQKSL